MDSSQYVNSKPDVEEPLHTTPSSLGRLFPQITEVEMRDMGAPLGPYALPRQSVGEGSPVEPPSPSNFSSVDFFSHLQEVDSDSDMGLGDDDDDREDPVEDRLLSSVGRDGYARFESTSRGNNTLADIPGASVNGESPAGASSAWRAKKKGHCVRRGCRKFFHSFIFATFVLLLLIGMGSAFILLFMDYSIEYIGKARRAVTESVEPVWLQFALWVGFPCLTAIMVGVIVQKVSKDAIGSGIPEVKSILSGIIVEKFLALRTLLSKIFGLIFAVGSGLYVGKEGPAVHISSALANNLMKLRPFRKIGKRHDLFMNIISAACSAGIAANFGSIIGGVLFAAEEVSAAYYLVSNLWKGMFAAVTGALFFFGIRGLVSSEITHLFSTNYGPIPYSFGELVLFVALGAICGLAGALWNRWLRFLFACKKRFAFLREARFSTILIMTITLAVITFVAGEFMMASGNESINELLSPKPLHRYGSTYKILALTFALVIKFLFSAMCFTLPMPAGLFAPNFLTGALIGRLFGEVVLRMFPGLDLLPGSYAIVGAAGMAAGVTRSLSTAVIIFELTGEISHLLPVLLGVMTSVGVGSLINLPVFEMILQIRGLPYFEEIQEPRNLDKVACEIMRKDLAFLTEVSSVKDVLRVLRRRIMVSYPVVNNAEEMILLGSVRRTQLENELTRFQRSLDALLQSQNVPLNSTFNRPDTSIPMTVRSVKDLSAHLEAAQAQDIQPVDTNPTVTFVNYVVNEMDVEAAAAAAGGGLAGPNVHNRSHSPFRRQRMRSRLRNDVDGVARVRPLIIDLDPAPYIFPAYTSLGKIHFQFTMISMSHGYVISSRGQLLGVITKKDLINKKL